MWWWLIGAIAAEGKVMREKQSVTRHVCDHCGVEILVTVPPTDSWQYDERDPEGWYRAEGYIPRPDGTWGYDSVRVDLCPNCGPPVIEAIRKRVFASA